MFDFKVLIVLATCLSWSYCKLDSYCSVCQDHTMCQFHGIGKNCTNVGGSGVTEEEKKEILDVHNWVRRIVASGYETRGAGNSQPKAANLRKLDWDGELAKVAQRWADQCRFEHDTCRNDPRFNVGQNIYWKWKYPTHHVNWTEAILSWYDEVSLYDPKEVEHYRFEPSTGHYTQILWHDTYAVGCGRRDYGPNKLYVCNYGPAGNWLGEPMYEIGEPCSKCPYGTVCDEYLCAVQSKKSEIETPSETNGLHTNALHGPPKSEKTPGKSGNESKHLDELKPPKENAKDVYASDGGKTKPFKCTNQTQLNVVNDEIRKQNDVLITVETEQKSEGSQTDDENEIDLDDDIREEIEEIKSRIEKLLKSVIRKERPPRGEP